jgi:phospholipid/cholesterol/gamma-HCH transport system permease protein
MTAPTVSFDNAGAQRVVSLHGDWTLPRLEGLVDALRAELGSVDAQAAERWNLDDVVRLDSLGACLLWRAWGDRLPALLDAAPQTRNMLESVSLLGARGSHMPAKTSLLDPVVVLGRKGLTFSRQGSNFLVLIGQLLLDLMHLARRPQDAPLREISANLYKAGVIALPITALVGFLVGVVLSYLSALQLKTFGADVFIINILGIGIVRELGPVLVAVLVAGRSGSAMTAQLGVMRVTEEIDALATMGVPLSLRLVLPKVVALVAAMPLLVLWTSAAALFGGMVAASIQLDMAYGFFLDTLPRVVPVANLYIGLAKGVMFGLVIALVACHFGLAIEPNTESLSANTTRSVVTAITCVILVDALFAIATRHIGLPGG